MGEKPLGIDEAPARMGTIVGGAPLGGVDVPPPAMAAGSINTTRSNIKNSGGVAEAAYDTPDGDELDPMAGAATINTTRSNIKNGGSVTDAGPDETIGGAGPAGMAAGSISTTRSNIKNGGAVAETGAGSGEVGVDAAPAGGAPGVAEGVGKPISGVDIIIKKNPPS